MMKSCDIFCRVIDNFGDIGVCWRLARQFAHEYALQVTLWVDDLQAFSKLAPTLNPQAAAQSLDGITVRHWAENFPSDARPSDCVIEGFASRLPESFLDNMARQATAPFWFNLEYLSAEDWVDDCHALPSVHPRTGLTQYFWFPGFSPRTGGLLREAALLDERQHFQQSPAAQLAFWSRLGCPDALQFQRRISLFAYENPAVHGLLSALASDTTTTLLLIPEGRILHSVETWLGQPLKVGDYLQRDSLSIRILPLLSHSDYDRLLWACELNCIRGEDSFVRAQWAARPFLWHIYPQAEEAHLIKLNAFIQRLEQHCGLLPVWAEAMLAWNQASADSPPWPHLLSQLPALQPAFQHWSAQLGQQIDLARQLILFCQRPSTE